MFCTNCGAEIADGNKFCKNCGASVQGEQVIDRKVVQTAQKQWQLNCPRCGNTNLQVQSGNRVLSSISTGRQVGRKSAIVGTSYNNIRETYWFCPNCGMQFRDLDELQSLINQYASLAKTGRIMTIISIIVVAVALIANNILVRLCAIIGIPMFAIGIGMWLGGTLVVKNRQREYDALLPKVRKK